MPETTQRPVQNESFRYAVDTLTYLPPEEAKKVAKELIHLGFGCPIGHKLCAEVAEIDDERLDQNVFVAIPYSNYEYENAIREVLTTGALTPKVAKDRIESLVILCKICKEMRKCNYGVVDISKNTVNVAYELGLMQSLGKKCAILLSTNKRLRVRRPTDLQGIENVTYGICRTLKRNLAKWIIGNVEECDANALQQYL